MERYPHHFRFCSKTYRYDGLELQLKIESYRESNPIVLSGVKPVKIQRNIRIKLDVHHIDEDIQNNDDSNLISLCYFCHQDRHKAFFTPEFLYSNRYLGYNISF